jgi:hypothetical protein
MKKLIIVLLVTLPFFTFSQEKPNHEPSEFEYAVLEGFQKILSADINVAIDFGQKKNFFTPQWYRDEQTGKVASFHSMADAMNFMAQDGWELVQAYTISLGSASKIYWVLKRKLQKE